MVWAGRPSWHPACCHNPWDPRLKPAVLQALSSELLSTRSVVTDADPLGFLFCC